MAKYTVEMQMDKQEKFYFIRENKSGDIVYLPSKYLMHKKRSKISPNTIRRSAFALSYYLNFMDEKQLCLDDVYQMKYIEQGVKIMVVLIGLVIIFKSQLTSLVQTIFEKITSESSGI